MGRRAPDDDKEVAIVGEAAASSDADVLAVARATHVRALSDARGTALDEIRPSFVVVFDPDAAFTREIETHKATRPRDFVRVYFMVHDTSVEEQRYLSSVRYETEAFDALVRAKQHMAMPAEMEGRLGDGAGLVAADASGRAGARTGHTTRLRFPAQLATRAEAAARARGGGALAVGRSARGGPALFFDAASCRGRRSRVHVQPSVDLAPERVQADARHPGGG